MGDLFLLSQTQTGRLNGISALAWDHKGGRSAHRQRGRICDQQCAVRRAAAHNTIYNQFVAGVA